MFNVDRWAVYSRQLYSRDQPNNRVISNYFLMTVIGDMANATPRQFRRMKKKSRKNNDGSIGIMH